MKLGFKFYFILFPEIKLERVRVLVGCYFLNEVHFVILFIYLWNFFKYMFKTTDYSLTVDSD